MMKRDMDLIRSILLKIEEYDFKPGEQIEVNPNENFLDGGNLNANTVYNHILLLENAGLINAWQRPHIISISRITWDGYDFIDAIRDPEIWRKTKNGLAAAGGLTLDVLKALAVGFIKQTVTQNTGIQL